MSEGVKHDGEKLRWDLLPVGPVREVVKVLTYAITRKKPKPYPANNWKHVPEARRRYYAAALRHLTDWRDPAESKIDAEFGLNHLAHAICCLVFLLWFDLEEAAGRWREGE